MKYAIFGGSFNPIHNGHIIIVQKMIDYIDNLDHLFIVPAACSPFKQGIEEQASFDNRYSWCTRSFKGIAGVSTIDIERADRTQSPSYTYKTLQAFYKIHHVYPTLIIGEDSLASFHRWKHHDWILENCKIAVFRRRGFSGNMTIEEKYLKQITVYDSPYIEISSTEIRDRIRTGKSIRGFVPETMEEEIIEKYRKMGD